MRVVLRIRLDRVAHVVREGQPVDDTFLEDLLVLFGNVDLIAKTLELLEDPLGIVASAVYIGPPVFLVHALLRHQDILGLAGSGINGVEADHAADLEIGIDLQAFLDGQGGSDKLIVGGLIHQLFRVLTAVEQDAAFLQHMVLDRVGLVVDLVEGHPVFDFILITLETGHRELDEHVDGLAVQESVILFDNGPGQLEMRQCYQGLDIVFTQLIK